MNTERTFPTGQVAQRLGVTVRTVYRWEDAGRLHPVRLPTGQRRFSSREVEGLLRARTGTAIRCAIYARVSSEKQAEAGNLDRQRERLLAATEHAAINAAAGAVRGYIGNLKRWERLDPKHRGRAPKPP